MKYAKVLARALLIFIFGCLIMPIIVIATSNSNSDSEELIIEETVVIEETVTETTEPTEEILIDTPILYSEVGYIVPITYEEAVEVQLSVKHNIDKLHSEVNSTMYTERASNTMLDEIDRLQIIYNLYQSDIDKFNTWLNEYPVATEVWFYLREQGFSESVTAGIIGNMMIETSGGTLSLKPEIYGIGHYGLCQWSLYYRPEVADMSLYEQLDYLMSDIKYEFDTFGFCYARRFGYEEFLNLDSCREAAIAFARVYERPGAGTYNIRANSAEIAYNYFTGK